MWKNRRQSRWLGQRQASDLSGTERHETDNVNPVVGQSDISFTKAAPLLLAGLFVQKLVERCFTTIEIFPLIKKLTPV